MTETISAAQELLVQEMPATVPELAEARGISESTVYDHFSAIREHYDLIKNDFGQYQLSEGDVGPTTIRKTTMGSSRKASRTREIRDFFDGFEDRLLSRLEATEPVRADGGMEHTPGGEDMVIYRTDDHHGALEEDQYGNDIFNLEISEGRVEQHFDAVLEKKSERERAGYEIDTLNILLGGDMVDGEGIYESQAWGQEIGLGGQIEHVANIYLKQILRMSEEFETVLIVTQTGNHGELRMGGQSSGANADGFVYSSIDLALRHSDVDNVTLLRSDATKFINFNMRGHNIHLRHGQSGLGHIGTSSAQQRWGSWLRRHRFDLALRGHYHSVKVEPIDDKFVLMGGTLEPSGEFAESLGIGENKARGLIFGANDDNPLAWLDIVELE